jgi:hypothetical protein
MTALCADSMFVADDRRRAKRAGEEQRKNAESVAHALHKTDEFAQALVPSLHDTPTGKSSIS